MKKSELNKEKILGTLFFVASYQSNGKCKHTKINSFVKIAEKNWTIIKKNSSFGRFEIRRKTNKNKISTKEKKENCHYFKIDFVHKITHKHLQRLYSNYH